MWDLAGVRLHLGEIYAAIDSFDWNLVMAVDSKVTVTVSHIATFGFVTSEVCSYVLISMCLVTIFQYLLDNQLILISLLPVLRVRTKNGGSLLTSYSISHQPRLTVVTVFIKLDTVWFIKKMEAGVNIVNNDLVNYVLDETPAGLQMIDTSVFLAPLCTTVARSGYQLHKVCISGISCFYRKSMLQMCLLYYLGGHPTLITCSILSKLGC